MGICSDFAILAAGLRLANACGLVAECMIHIVCIMAIMILSCHNVLMFNHATLVLGYLLLYGYDVTGEALFIPSCGDCGRRGSDNGGLLPQSQKADI